MRLAVDRFASIQHRQNEFAVRGHLDGDRYDINQVIADHRERIGKPAINAEGFSGLPCTLLVARCHSRELQAGKTVDRRNVDGKDIIGLKLILTGDSDAENETGPSTRPKTEK
jgi:hypothetical protein